MSALAVLLRAAGAKTFVLAADGSAAASDGSGVVLSASAIAALEEAGFLHREKQSIRRNRVGATFLKRQLTTVDSAAPQPQEAAVQPLPGAPARNVAECPLTWLASRRDKTGHPMISAPQLAAGQRLHRDYCRAQYRPSVTQSWDASGVRSPTRRDGLTTSEAAIAAKGRVEGALCAVGPGLAEALVGVCCEELGLESVEKRHGWPARSGKVILRMALDRLAGHYGIGAEATGFNSAAIVSWGGCNSRPAA